MPWKKLSMVVVAVQGAPRTQIFVDVLPLPAPARTVKTLSTGAHPILPQDLASDIQQFVESECAQQYFATHRTGFIFKRKVPVGQMMEIAKRAPTAGSNTPWLEEARWLLREGLANGELRDEVYCQVMKQLTNNPNADSTFRGWQLRCVLLVTFPPSKNFEPYLHAFLSQHTGMTQGRVDVLAKHCVKRLAAIAKKGYESVARRTSQDAAFNQRSASYSMPCSVYKNVYTRLRESQSYFRSSPDGVPRTRQGQSQEGNLSRTRATLDAVAALKMRLDRGSYTLEGVDDPHVPASLFKRWLRELVDPLVPSEMYNNCIAFATTLRRAVRRIPLILLLGRDPIRELTGVCLLNDITILTSNQTMEPPQPSQTHAWKFKADEPGSPISRKLMQSKHRPPMLTRECMFKTPGAVLRMAFTIIRI
ncbi:MyTH4 domain-containing protein [Lactarius indigo]|nr:MyTH4 domain-containing protein [Lactarius indigo]